MSSHSARSEEGPSADPDALRSELLAQTIHHAVEATDLFRGLYSGHRWQRVKHLDDLELLPVLTRDLVDVADEGRLDAGQEVALIQHTSGSTGKPLPIYRGQRELAFIQAFFRAVLDMEPNKPFPVPIAVHIPPLQHGSPVPIPGFALSIPTAISSDGLLRHTIALLKERFSAPGIASQASLLSGGQTELVTLTAALQASGIDRSEFAVGSLHMTGRSLTPRLEEFLAGYWQVPIRNRFSMADVFGGASNCPRCGYFHFDPHVVAEVVDGEGSRLSPGVPGRLLLTSLYPFVQMQPMIRYDTGDLAQWVDSPCGAASLEHLGRRAHALARDHDGCDVLLSGTELEEALDSVPEVRRTRHYEDLKDLPDPSIGGRPKCRGTVSYERDRVAATLDFEVDSEVAADPARARVVEDKVLQSLYEHGRWLRRSDPNVELRPRAVASDSIPPTYKKTPMWVSDKDTDGSG